MQRLAVVPGLVRPRLLHEVRGGGEKPGQRGGGQGQERAGGQLGRACRPLPKFVSPGSSAVGPRPLPGLPLCRAFAEAPLNPEARIRVRYSVPDGNRGLMTPGRKSLPHDLW